MTKRNKDFVTITEEINTYTDLIKDCSKIEPELFVKYDVKRGLRDLNGVGVITGITNISHVKAKEIIDGVSVPCAGRIFYRGYDVEDIINSCMKNSTFGFEEISYLLLFGKLPTKEELKGYEKTISNYRSLPVSFVRDVLLKKPSIDMMNAMSKGVLTLYSYDKNPDDVSLPNVLKQCLQLIAQFPLLAIYAYNSSEYYNKAESLYIHHPREDYSTAENLLHMLRPDSKFTDLEAKVLDIALILHAEHGGGNNSSFTTRVVSSTGTDTYSAISAALGSLKGPKHGGANIKVIEMFTDMKEHLTDWTDEDQISSYINDLLNKKAFDKQGSVYGIGHAIYSISDPRAQIFRGFVEALAKEKGRSDEFELYARVERLAPEIIAKQRKMYKGISANVDFFSGFAYEMLGLPVDLYTPLFAVARIVGWSAHRIEELIGANKIIRPAYKSIVVQKDYVPMEER